MKLSGFVHRGLLWLAVVGWVAIIFLTLPYAPIWRDWVVEHFTVYSITISVATIIAAFLVFTIVKIIRRKAPPEDYLFFTLVTVGYTYSLLQIKIIVEQVHFLEYGLLAFLIINALRFDRKDPPQYLNAILLVTLVGVVDEYIQGVLVNRVGELHDVYLNILSGALALVWHRLCFRPKEGDSDWSAAALFGLPVMGLIILCVGIFNSRISEFGHYIEDPEIGAFYSRLSHDEITNELPQIQIFRERELPKLYLKPYSGILKEIENPVHAEALVHIFRRDKRLQRDKEYITAHRENQILEKYFYAYIADTERQWSEEMKSRIAELSAERLAEYYISPVSAHIITEFSEKEQGVVVVILEICMLSGWMILVLKRKTKVVGKSATTKT